MDTPKQAGFTFELLGSEGGKAELFGAINQFLSGVAGDLETELTGGQLGAKGLEEAVSEHTETFFETVGADDHTRAFVDKVLDLYTMLVEGRITPAATDQAVTLARNDLVTTRFPEEVVGA